jgi:hypothetical protein
MRLPRRTIINAVAAASAGGLVFAGGLTTAHAASLACGDVVTVDTTLTSDLACAGPGLYVAADVTLDLAGHTIRGSGIGDGVSFWDPVSDLRADSATVRNGAIRGFASGIDANASTSVALDRLRISKNTSAVSIPDVLTLSVTGSHLAENGVGISGAIFGATITVRSSTIAGNGAAFDVPFADVDVDDSTISRNGNIATCSQGHINFLDTKVVGNRGGIDMFECDPSSFIRTVFDHNGAVLSASEMYFQDGLVIRDSRFVGNASAVAELRDVASAQITGNVFERNAAGLVFDCGPGCGVNGGTIASNRFVRNAADGVRINDGSAFDISDNVALRNGGWGLYAAPSVAVTGVGNTAHDNGQPAQCSGVPCN